jgi:hypothetical protein
VHALRNEIRVAVGRYEREVESGFTKEALAAICEALGSDVAEGSLPSKEVMRAEIRSRVGRADAGGDASADPDAAGEAFRKADLEAIADALREA